MQDIPWNLKPIIIGRIKEKSRTNKIDAIKDGRIAKDKVSGTKRKKKICGWQTEKAPGKANKCKGIHIQAYLGKILMEERTAHTHISRENT